MLANADVAVAASLGQMPAPGLLVRAGAGAVPVAPRLPVYEEVVGDGLLFEPGDVDVLAGQLERLYASRRCSSSTASPTSRGAASRTRRR